MPYFEITGQGYDASTDETDHKVLWVKADSRAQIEAALLGCLVEYVGDLGFEPDADAGLDFILPGDAAALRGKLFEFAGHEKSLVHLLRELLACPDLQLEGLEDDTVAAMFNANLYLTTHFPKDPA